MNIADTKKALRIARQMQVTLNLIGAHGLGKSSVVKQYTKEEGMNYKEFRTGQAADAGDLTGLPDFQLMNEVDVDGSELVYKYTDFVLPAWFPRKKNTVVFFDEVNRGSKDILNGVFEAILDFSMKGIPMPDGCQIVSAMNPPTGDYSGTVDFDDKAWQDRFVHVRFQPDFREFHSYQSSKHGQGGFLTFLQENDKMLNSGNLEGWNLDFVVPSSRSWETAFKLEKMYDASKVDRNLFLEMLFGIVGPIAAQAALAFKDTHVSAIKGADLIENYHNPEIRARLLAAVQKNRSDLVGDALQNIGEEFKLREDKGLRNQEGLNLISLARDLQPEQTYTLLTIIAQNHKTCNNVDGMDGGGVESEAGLLNNDELISVLLKTKAAREKAGKAAEKAKAKKTKKETEEV